MPIDAAGFLAYQIANAELRRYPFPHFFVHPAFPEAYYQELLDHLPRTESLKPLTTKYGTAQDVEGGEARGESRRYIADVAKLGSEEAERGETFWSDLAAWMTRDEFRFLVLDKFSAGIQERFGSEAKLQTEIDTRFIRDFTRYAIAPHTDTPRKLVSLLFYLPPDTSLSPHGTSIYMPIDPDLRCEGSARHAFDKFRRVATMPFVPNALLGFVKSDRSFHGVEEIAEPGVVRDLLLYNIYVRKAVVPEPAARAPRFSLFRR